MTFILLTVLLKQRRPGRTNKLRVAQETSKSCGCRCNTSQLDTAQVTSLMSHGKAAWGNVVYSERRDGGSR